MNARARFPFLARLDWPHFRIAFSYLFLVTAWFACVFATSDWFTAQRMTRVRVHLDAELHIPLIPAFVVVYMSIYLLFLAAPFVLRTRRELTSLAAAQSFAIFVAGICFLLIPAQLAFIPATDTELGLWKSLFRFADRLNLNYNLVPSLHVTLSVVCIEMFAAHVNTLGKTLLRFWGVSIAASTLFTHQHHVVDTIAGYLLALGTVKLVCPARARKPRQELFSPARQPETVKASAP